MWEVSSARGESSQAAFTASARPLSSFLTWRNAKMSKPAWHFKKKRPSDTARDPISSEFFADESVEDAARSVIREAIQNSLDARDRASGAPVEIHLHLGTGRHAIPAQRAGLFFKQSWEHLSAPKSGLRHPPQATEACAYLTIEDFGTSGLEADPLEWTPNEHTTNAFYAFFRAEAYSEKSGDDRGRWGVGKLVFPRSSRASAFFGYTVQRSTGRPLLMGRMILRHHRAGQVEYLPDAFFGIQETVHEDPEFVVPISDMEYISFFAETFGITRRTEPGLSVVIPWLEMGDDEEFTADNLARAIASEYLLPILRGELVATVTANGSTARLDRSELLKDQQRWTDDSVSVLLRVGQYASSLDPGNVEFTRSAEQSGAPKWPDAALSKEHAEVARDTLNSGDPVAFNIPVHVYKKRDPSPQTSHLRVHLISTGSTVAVAPVFVREGITVTNARGQRIPGFLALVTIDDGPLATLLGDAENPAHTEWRPATRGFKEQYRFGKSFLDFVRNAPINLFKAIFEGEREDDIYSLASFFPDPASIGNRQGGGSTAERRKGGGVNPPPPVPKRQRRYSVARIAQGFEIRRGDPDAPRPERLRIRAAYDVRRGNPLKRWAKFDFDLGNREMTVAALGARVRHASGNELIVDIDQDEFIVSVRGFDPNRDVFTRVTVEEDDGDQEV